MHNFLLYFTKNQYSFEHDTIFGIFYSFHKHLVTLQTMILLLPNVYTLFYVHNSMSITKKQHAMVWLRIHVPGVHVFVLNNTDFLRKYQINSQNLTKHVSMTSQFVQKYIAQYQLYTCHTIIKYMRKDNLCRYSQTSIN